MRSRTQGINRRLPLFMEGGAPRWEPALTSVVAPMPQYRFFLWTDPQGKIDTVDAHQCADDMAAVNWADAALKRNPKYVLVEVWKDDGLVGRQQR